MRTLQRQPAKTQARDNRAWMSLMKNLGSGQRRHKENGAERRQKRREHRLFEESTLIELKVNSISYNFLLKIAVTLRSIKNMVYIVGENNCIVCFLLHFLTVRIYTGYNVSGLLGKGSFGAVYSAVRKTDGRKVNISISAYHRLTGTAEHNT